MADADAPIVAALASHEEGLAAVDGEVARLEGQVKSWGRQRGLRHGAEVLEVRLTEQLLLLDTMLNDCVTSRGRGAVKQVVARLRALGARLRVLLS